MKTIILTKEDRDGKKSGTWLRDLGFQLIEAGCEINLTGAEGDDAREVLEKYDMEVVQVVEGFTSSESSSKRLRRPETSGVTLS